MKIFSIIFLLLIYIYICQISFLPASIVLMEGEEFPIKTIIGVDIMEEKDSIFASNNMNKQTIEQVGKSKASVKLFGKLEVKDVDVYVVPKTKVVPLGNSIGMKLYTKGVLVVGMSEIKDMTQKVNKPYENSGIEEGDMIVAVNNTNISCTQDLIDSVNKSEGKNVAITYLRENEEKQTNIVPVKTEESEYKLGLWVRDATAGVGTLSFYEPSSGMFAALGHGIMDIDTAEIVNISNGQLITTNIVSIVKGEKGKPGEIRGTIEEGKQVGVVSKNTEFGVYGLLKSKSYLGIKEEDAIEVAAREEIKEGKAEIICQLGNNQKETYEIQIQKLYLNNSQDNKSMLIKITDKRLLEQTGGIIQGMSGSPIIQNGKLVGAVTNVLVNDPTVGYGVFGDMMIKQLREN